MGATKKLDSGIGNTNASTANIVSTTDARNAKLPGELEHQALVNTSQGLSNAGKVTQNAASEVDLKTKQDAYALDKPLNDALIQFGANADNYKTDEEAAEAFFNIYGKHRPDEAMAMRSKYSASEVKEILMVGEKNSAEIQVLLADPTKGLPSVVQWIDDHNGIATGAMVRGDEANGFELVSTNQGSNQPIDVIASGATEAELIANLATFTTPGGATKLAAQMLEQRKLDSEIELNKTTGLKNVAQAGYYDAQAAGENNGGKWSEQKALAWANYRRSDAYVDEVNGMSPAKIELSKRKWASDYDEMAKSKQRRGLGTPPPPKVKITKEK